MPIQHKELSRGGWQKFSIAEQLGNVGSEVSRAIQWRGRDEKLFQGAVDRALELLDLTLQDSRWHTRLKELARAREFLCDIVFGENQYSISLEDLDKFFLDFAIIARTK